MDMARTQRVATVVGIWIYQQTHHKEIQRPKRFVMDLTEVNVYLDSIVDLSTNAEFVANWIIGHSAAGKQDFREKKSFQTGKQERIFMLRNSRRVEAVDIIKTRIIERNKI